ncbi:hypothetical protein N0B44_00485 [Roseibacterium beibuensis]|uniref:DUF4760 domain-containing protein n=1 Tax=[Roseibacterium] beibuensis TaxID=1193142 RepID=A0ABP9L5Q8_9RHOB|nr:hypothetical protein [Roseibacterium beibuensis]MCS6621377.1 hypothetical protein [Roseibacterium beibuensis]
MEAVGDFLAEFLDGDVDSVSGALILLLVSSAVAVIGAVLRAILTGVLAWNDRRRHRKEALTDIVIYARTYFLNVHRVASDAALQPVRAEIEKDPTGFRGFNAAVSDDDVYLEYKEIRRSLSAEEMSLCDTFFDRARIFQTYYLKLATEDFRELSRERKLRTLDTLKELGVRLVETYETLREKGPEFSAIAAKIKLEDVLPDPREQKSSASGSPAGQDQPAVPRARPPTPRPPVPRPPVPRPPVPQPPQPNVPTSRRDKPEIS